MRFPRCTLHPAYPQDPHRLSIPRAAPQAGAGQADRRPPEQGYSCPSCSPRPRQPPHAPGTAPPRPAPPAPSRRPGAATAPHLVAEDGPLDQAGVAVQAHPRVAAAPHGPTAGPAARPGRARAAVPGDGGGLSPPSRRSGAGRQRPPPSGPAGTRGQPCTRTERRRGRLVWQKPGCVCKK